VLLHERGAILASFTEKSDDFAQSFVANGTFGFIAGHPSASTQPLYGFFLVPVYWLLGRHWWSVGGAQILVAVAAALLVYEIGRRFLSKRAGLLAALGATLHPYLVWHDVHVNREILDQLLGAAMVLLALLAARRGSVWLAAALGVVAGLSILSNTRLVLLPLVLAGYLVWRLGRAALVPAALLLVVAALSVAPWVVRNRVQLGCWSITTDARALWKANTLQTYDVLARGGWIDDVPPLPNAPWTPEMQGAKWKVDHVLLPVDECAQQRLYEGKVEDFWREHPGEKARLAGQATAMLWSPVARSDSEASAGGGSLARRLVEPVYMGIAFALAAVGLFLVPRALAVLAVAFLAYETLAAAVFAGTTRYRVPWDFVLMLLVAAAVTMLPSRLPSLRRSSHDR
jgi:4-amino-4-deoxy-L-arabinose transferase-like glycosyltransferase